MLNVSIDNRRAGAVTYSSESQHFRQIDFKYDPEYLLLPDAVPLSVTMPLTKGSHDAGAWLEGLMPDHGGVAQRWQYEHDLDCVDVLSLLGSPVGQDCAGAVHFRPANVSAVSGSGVHVLSEEDVAAIIRRLTVSRAAWGNDYPGAGFALAGAQAKTALRYENGVWGVPYGGEPTTHILKPSIAGFADQHIVEHLSQRSAALMGLPAANTECVNINGQGAILVERFDRVRSEDGVWSRVHQEDLCQALGFPPSLKYQTDSGPSPAQVGEILRKCSSDPDTDLRMFRDALIYNWLIVGSDAHAKNYSIVLRADSVSMAPLYDVCSLLPYREDMSRRNPYDKQPLPVSKMRLAMKIGRDYTILKSDYREAWVRTSQSLSLPAEETLDRATELAALLPEAMNTAANELPGDVRVSPKVERLVQEIGVRARHCAQLKQMNVPSKQGSC